ncbi:MAG: tRNA-modifying protein YgfZ, partial [Vibrio sp.]
SQDQAPELLLSYLDNWTAIQVNGDDKKSYLSGQLTCDIVTLDKSQSSLGAHCDPKGKMWSVFRLFHHQDGYALFQTRSAIETALSELKKYAVFSKVTIEQSQDLCFGLIGSQAKNFIQTHANSDADVCELLGGTAVKVSDLRYLILIPADKANDLIQLFEDGHKVDHRLWDCYDIIEALPRINAEDQQAHIPQAMNLQAIGGISFTKGCYTGQETVARAKYRGINKRAMMILSGSGEINEADLTQKLAIERQVGDNWRGAGDLLVQYQYSDQQFIALAVLPNNLDMDTRFRLTEHPEVELTMQSLPYSLEDEA